MTLIKPLRWWGFLDDKGHIHVKLYVDDKSIQRYEQLPMVKGIFDPFEAWDSNDARRKCYEKYKEIMYHEKKAH